MRLGGLFPFDISWLNGSGGIVTLQSGQAFYPPAGNYLLSLGSQTVLQQFDPVSTMWRNYMPPWSGVLPISVDGANWRLMNLSGVVVGGSITNAGSGATANGIGPSVTGVTVAIAAPTSGITALGYAIVGGSVPAPTVTAGGAGFVVPPIVLCDPPPTGGIQARFTAQLTAGAISGITQVDPGAGYTQIPNFYVIPQFYPYPGAPPGGSTSGIAAGINPPPGQVSITNQVPATTGGVLNTSTYGAVLTGNALTGSLTLTGLVVYNFGSGYTGTTIPAITITGCGAAAATAIMSMCLTSTTQTAGGAGYGTSAPLFQTSEGVITNLNQGNVFIPRAASGVGVASAGAISSLTIQDPGFGMQAIPSLAVINTTALATTQATFTPVLGGQVDVSILQAFINE